MVSKEETEWTWSWRTSSVVSTISLTQSLTPPSDMQDYIPENLYLCTHWSLGLECVPCLLWLAIKFYSSFKAQFKTTYETSHSSAGVHHSLSDLSRHRCPHGTNYTLTYSSASCLLTRLPATQWVPWEERLLVTSVTIWWRPATGGSQWTPHTA